MHQHHLRWLSAQQLSMSIQMQQIYISPMRVKPLRAVTSGYTGPAKSIYGSITPIPELQKHISMIETIVKSKQPPSAYKITQYLRGQLFSNVNSLLTSDLKLSHQQINLLNNFLIQLVDQICKICLKTLQYLPQYFQLGSNNKFLYLVDYKVATVCSLQQLLYLLNILLAQPNQFPKLFKNYKNQILQLNLINHTKKYIDTFVQLCTANDGNGKWLPSNIRISLSKVLSKFKEEDKFLSIKYDVKDYLQFYSCWPIIMQLYPSQQNEKKIIDYLLTAIINYSPFDAKLKSLVMLRKILQKEQKLNNLQVSNVIEMINKKNIVNSLLQNFNAQIFKRYIPILKICSSQVKKTLTQSQIDDLFKIMKTGHESQANLIYQIIVSISEFINIDTLDSIYADIQKNIDINNENGLKFIKNFTIKAIQNFNNNKNKGFISTLMGRKKNSSKYGYFGLDLLFKEISDGYGKIIPKNIAFAILNIGQIFENDVFHHQRFSYMQSCIANIEKRQSYGQSIKVLYEIIETYPENTFISQTQDSVVGKLDDKYKLIDTFIKGLKPLQKEANSNKNSIKVDFLQSIKYFYEFIQKFNNYLKYKMQIRHINHLWHMPYIFQFLRKAKETVDSQIPSWKRKYYKKISLQMIKGILTQILKIQENIIPSQQCFDAIHELILSFNLGKSLQLTERATIRYINLQNIVGLNFYFKFLEKALKIEAKSSNKEDNKSIDLIHKVIKTIFQIHLRPHNHEAIDTKAQNWKKCLMKVIQTIHKEQVEICLNSIQLFLQLIKGRQFKQISATGKIDIIVSHEQKQKTVSLPRNSTILKMRNIIMQMFKIKCNFIMYNTALKRDITYIQEEDFSVNAMSHAIKGPTIILKRLQQHKKYPLTQANQVFMNLIENQEEFYKIVFGLLKQQQSSAALQSRIWKLIEKIPINQSTKNKIKNCKDFQKMDWENFLQPTQMEELQYSINIIYNLLTTSKWMQDFKKTQGSIVIEQLYLTMLGSIEPLGQKIRKQLSKIIIKIIEHNTGSHHQDKKQQKIENNEQLAQENTENLQKITKKIMQVLQQQIQKYENSQATQSTECLNLMMKILILSSVKKNCPDYSVLLKYFLNDKILIKMSDLILFQAKNVDSSFFIEDILEKVILNSNLQFSFKCQIFRQFICKYLNVSVLSSKVTTENYFIFLIDFLHSMDKQEHKKIYENYNEIVVHIKDYIQQTLGCKIEEQGKITNDDKQSQITEEMVHGSLKLLNQSLTLPIFNYDLEKIFTCLLDNFVLSQVTLKPNADNQLPQSQSKSRIAKSKLKYKKILYDIIKLMIFNRNDLLNIFVQKIAPRLQHAEWRRNIYSSWILEQQKKEKKFFCGLENLAATCYINCLFQQLFMIKRFTDRFISIDSLAYKQLPQTNQIYQLQKLLVYLKYGNKRSYTTRPFCQSFITYEGVPIDPTVQNDADEFFNTLMEKIQSFLKSTGHHHILQDTFEGKLSNQLNCQGCPHSSEKIQPFLSIGLNIKNKKTLQSALDGYVEGQILDGNNAYFCQICQKKVRTMKRMCIKQVPNILVIVLKRFTFNFDEMRKIKINDELKFSKDLNIKKYTSEFNLGQQCKPDEYYDYKLRGAVIHSGTSEGGHYYSFIKESSENNAKWFQFNDEIIQQAEYKRIQEEGFGGEQKDSQFRSEKYKNAYILFYQKNIKIQKNDTQQKIKSNEKNMMVEQSFQDQLSQMVKSQNRNAEFLSIILDQLFIRLCQNIAMCGHEKANHFIMLYFHTVLVRDKNKQEEHLVNIYRIILTLMSSSIQLCIWYIQQIDQNYIKQFLIQAPKLVRYLCLGFLKQAIKIVNDHQNSLIKQIGQSEQINGQNKQQKVKVTQQKQNVVKQTETSANNQVTQQQKQQKMNQQPTIQKSDHNNQKQQIIVSEQKPKNSNNEDFIKQILKRNEDTMQRLICCLLSSLKPKGMSPFAKIFTYLSSIPKYKQILQKYQYPERVAQILLNLKQKPSSVIEYQHKESYFGKQNSNKQKDLEGSFSFLIQSLRYYPGILSKQNILSLLSDSSSRPAIKSLSFLLAKSCKSSQQVLQSIEVYQTRLMGEKYRRQDIQKYLFIIRYFMFLSSKSSKHADDAKKLQYLESVKSICINSLNIVIKTNQTSYIFMELAILEINKLAFILEDFKKAWAEKVSNHQNLYKSIQYWVSESSRPHLMQRCQQWKKKTINLSYNEKQILLRNNKNTQEQRTGWMLQKKNFKTKRQQRQQTMFDFKQEDKIQNKDCQVPQIHSQLQLTQINKNITVGFKTFKIYQRLGVLTKVQDDKGMCRWAIMERNDIQTHLDF